MEDDLVLLGRVTKPHGIRGEIKVYPYSGLPDNFFSYSSLILESGDNSRCWTVERVRVQKNRVLLKLEGCDSRNAAELLVGAQVCIQRSGLPEIGEDEYYLHDLLGKEMMAEDGRSYGVIHGILPTGGQDIARVRQGDREYLIPLVADFLIAVETERVIVDLPPGLLDINT